MQSPSEIVRVRNGLVEQLWKMVDHTGTAEYTETLARIDTLNWVLTSEEEPRTVEGPAMTLASLIAEDEQPDPPAPEGAAPLVAAETVADTDPPAAPPTVWETLRAGLKRGTDAVIHSTGSMTPTEILNIKVDTDTGSLIRMSPTYSARRHEEPEI